MTSSIANLTISDLDKDISFAKNIGWVIKHSDLMNVFFNEIDNHKNIYFLNPKELSQKKLSFDYKFIATGANPVAKIFSSIFDFKKSYNQSCLTFKILVRGNSKSVPTKFLEEGLFSIITAKE